MSISSKPVYSTMHTNVSWPVINKNQSRQLKVRLITEYLKNGSHVWEDRSLCVRQKKKILLATPHTET